MTDPSTSTIAAAADGKPGEQPIDQYQRQQPEKFSTYMSRRKVVFLVAYVGYVCAYMVRNNFKLQSETIRLENGWELSQVGLILTAFTITYGFAKFFMGALADRVSLRRIFAGCLGLSAVLCIGIGYVDNFYLLFGLMLALGVVQGALAPSSMAMIANWYPNKSRGSGIAIWNTSQNLGGAGLPLLLTWLVTTVSPGSTSIGFLIPGILVLGLSFIFWKFGGDRPDREGLDRLSTMYGAAGEPQVEVVPDESYLRSFVRYVLTSQVVLTIGLINAILYFVRFGVLNWMPAFLGTEMGFSEAQYLTAFALLEWVAIPGCFFFAWIAVKMPNKQALVGGIGLLVLAAAVYLYMGNTSYPALLVISGVMGALIYGPQLIVNIMTLNVVPLKAAGVAVGFVGLFGYIVGEMAANLVMPILAERLSWNASFLVLSAFAVLGGALYLSLSRYERRIVAA
ncbi:MFS transporter [Oerskovia sp. NPDC057915]|uniref:MFS transporter n=1 Tax=Oerskovia sp. NPDC057915 TaxID=3346280 RepID=UPI0036DDD32A